MTEFTHLHVASAFSSHFGVTRPELLAEAAAAQKMTALAITDRDGLYGAVKHIGACLTLGMSPIVGVELSIVDDEYQQLSRAVVLARGHDRGVGWSTLCAIVSAAHGYNIGDALSENSKKLQRARKSESISIRRGELARLIGESMGACTVLLGTDSDVGKSVLRGSRDEAIALLEPWQELFSTPNSLAIEICSLLTEPGTESSVLQANRMLQLADFAKLPAVLTNSVRYLTPDGKFVSLNEEGPEDAYWAEVYDGSYGHVYFGHQPFMQETPKEFSHATSLDTGCVYGGWLSAVIIENGNKRYVSVKAKEAYSLLH
jgi:error-prone DNA polymerase